MHGPVMHADLEPEGSRPTGRRGELRLGAEHRAQRGDGPPEDGHDRVPDRLHDRAALVGHRVAEDVEMADDRAVRRRVPDLAVEAGRVAQVGEDDRQAADGHVLAGTERLGGEQVAKRLERGHVGGARGLIRPTEPLGDVEPLDVGRVLEDDGRPVPGGRHRERGGVVETEPADPVAAGLEGKCDLASLARSEELLRDDVRRQTRPADAEALHLDLAHGRARPERELDRALEIGLDVDQAAVAVHARAELAEGGHRLRRAATERTEELPAGLEQADPRGQQAELEHGATVGTPGIGECVRTQPGGRDVVEPGELRREEVDELGRGAPLLELRTQRLQPLLPSRRERRPRARRELGRALGEHPVVAAEGLVHAPPGDPADCHGNGRTTGRAARSRVNLVGEQAPRAAPLELELRA